MALRACLSIDIIILSPESTHESVMPTRSKYDPKLALILVTFAWAWKVAWMLPMSFCASLTSVLMVLKRRLSVPNLKSSVICEVRSLAVVSVNSSWLKVFSFEPTVKLTYSYRS